MMHFPPVLDFPYIRKNVRLYTWTISQLLMTFLYSFIHYGDLYSAPSRLLLRSAPDPCTAKKKSFESRVECVVECVVSLVVDTEFVTSPKLIHFPLFLKDFILPYFPISSPVAFRFLCPLPTLPVF